MSLILNNKQLPQQQQQQQQQQLVNHIPFFVADINGQILGSIDIIDFWNWKLKNNIMNTHINDDNLNLNRNKVGDQSNNMNNTNNNGNNITTESETNSW